MTIATRAVEQCLPPTVRMELLSRLSLIHTWISDGGSLKTVKRARTEVSELTPAIEQATLSAVAGALSFATEQTLERQAAITVRRYAARSVHHTTACALMTFDSVMSPKDALALAEEAAGAIAFHKVGLGAARSSELRRWVRERAQWEVESMSLFEQPAAAIELQLYHEYLGAHWQDHAAAQRAYFADVIARDFVVADTLP